jgi:hypothetical protein
LKFKNDTGLEMGLQLFNVFNDRTPLALVTQEGAEFGDVFTKQRARSARVLLKYSF